MISLLIFLAILETIKFMLSNNSLFALGRLVGCVFRIVPKFIIFGITLSLSKKIKRHPHGRSQTNPLCFLFGSSTFWWY